jgi:Nitrile hydratase, alpha chain
MTDATNAFAKVIAKAWGDDAFRAQLLADPNAALAAEGITAPEGKTFAIVEDTDDVVHVVLPARPTELSDDELDSVAGGMSYIPPCGTREGGFSL